MSLNKMNYVDGQTIISAQNMNDIQDEVIRLDNYQITLNNKINIQPDYEQNDSAAIDYIKNRPFYSSTVYKSYPRYSLQQPKWTTYTDITGSGYYELLNGQYGSDISDLFSGSTASFIKGQEYLVDISGYQFICKAKVDDSSLPEPIIYLGNASLIDKTIFEDTGEVFCIAHITYDNSRTLITIGSKHTDYDFFSGGFNYRLAIAKIISEFKTIDPIFLPEATATTKGAVLVDDNLNKDSKNAISNSAVFTQLENKVDKVNGKGLSDVNFTKAYEDQVKNISSLIERIDVLENYNSNTLDELEEELIRNFTPLTAINIASNPQGAYITTGNLMQEYNKMMSGQASDKITLLDDNGRMAYKISDKIPSKNDLKKGFSILVESFDNVYAGPTRAPLFGWTFSKALMGNSTWETMFNYIVQEENGIVSIGFGDFGIVILSHDYNDFNLTPGVYAVGNTEAFVSGLEIYDFDLNNTAAPVSQEQLGDISSILDSIIGEEVWTFTLEDGSTVDKVVISSD